MTYHVGQRVAHAPPSLILSGVERWHALVVPAGQEERARERLSPYGVACHWPEMVRQRRQRTGELVPVRKPLVSGYVFSLFPGEPRWHVLAEMLGAVRVVSRGSEPVTLSDEEMDRVAGLATAERRRREAERARLLASDLEHRMAAADGPVPATVDSGPLEGLAVDVTSLRDYLGRRLARIVSMGGGLLGRTEMEVDASTLRVREA